MVIDSKKIVYFCMILLLGFIGLLIYGRFALSKKFEPMKLGEVSSKITSGKIIKSQEASMDRFGRAINLKNITEKDLLSAEIILPARTPGYYRLTGFIKVSSQAEIDISFSCFFNGTMLFQDKILGNEKRLDLPLKHVNLATKRFVCHGYDNVLMRNYMDVRFVYYVDKVVYLPARADNIISCFLEITQMHSHPKFSEAGFFVHNFILRPITKNNSEE